MFFYFYVQISTIFGKLAVSSFLKFKKISRLIVLIDLINYKALLFVHSSKNHKGLRNIWKFKWLTKRGFYEININKHK